MKFMNLPEEYSSKKSKTIILPITFKSKTTRETFSDKGPLKIIEASYELEYYDEEIDVEPYEKGIFQEEILEILETDYLTQEQKIIKKILEIEENKFLVVLGADHSTTISVVKALEQKNNDLGVIIFDAHTDLRDSGVDECGLHACVSSEISKKHKTLVCGVRSMDVYDKEQLKNKNIDIIKTKELFEDKDWYLKKSKILKKKLKKLPQKVYISIDVDVFDCSFIRNTGTPEPGGLFFEQLKNLLKLVFKEKDVIGVDIVEYSPNKESFSESYSLAKLVYKIIAYKHH
jgi:agmatinase